MGPEKDSRKNKAEMYNEAIVCLSLKAVTKILFSQVGWLRAEDQTVLSLHERVVLGGRYSVSYDAPQTWQLRIRPLRAEDRGCYMCQINTQPLMKWQIGCIDVYGKIQLPQAQAYYLFNRNTSNR